jgi:hypothetical protein
VVCRNESTRDNDAGEAQPHYVLVWLHKRGALNRYIITYWKTESHDLYGDVRQQILEGFGLTGMRFLKNQNMGLVASRCSEGSS